MPLGIELFVFSTPFRGSSRVSGPFDVFFFLLIGSAPGFGLDKMATDPFLC